MRIERDPKAEAQALADRIHQWLIANDRAYAKSVADGQTLRWDVPRQQVDEKGVVTNQKWRVIVKPRVTGALSASERAEMI